MSEIEIYCFAPMDRSGRVRWLLEELGQSYTDKHLDYQKGENKHEDYLKLNPMGTVPTVVMDGKPMVESAAICTYIADKHADKGFAPALDSELRAGYLQWMFYTAATLEPTIVEAFKISKLSDEEKAAKLKEIATAFAPMGNFIASALGENDYILGKQFFAVDILLGSTLHWAAMFGFLKDFPSLTSYTERVKSRPAAQKAKAFDPIPGM